jgi:flagellar basal-body rod protein FlgG
MNTTGFKRQRAAFQDLLYQQETRPGSAAGGDGQAKVPTGIQIGAGVKTGGVYRITEQGAPNQTGNRYDIAIQGRGYFQVTLPSGQIGFTRDGSFQLSEQGELVTADGFRVEPAIVIPPEAVDVAISKTGEVQVKLANDPASSKPPRRGSRPSPRRASRALATRCRALSRRRTSTRCPRSPR